MEIYVDLYLKHSTIDVEIFVYIAGRRTGGVYVDIKPTKISIL